MVAAFAGKNLLESSVLFRVFGFLGRIAISARWLRCFEYNDLVQWVQLWFQTEIFSTLSARWFQRFHRGKTRDFNSAKLANEFLEFLIHSILNAQSWFPNSWECARLKSFETYRSPLSHYAATTESDSPPQSSASSCAVESIRAPTVSAALYNLVAIKNGNEFYNKQRHDYQCLDCCSDGVFRRLASSLPRTARHRHFKFWLCSALVFILISFFHSSSDCFPASVYGCLQSQAAESTISNRHQVRLSQLTFATQSTNSSENSETSDSKNLIKKFTIWCVSIDLRR